MSGSIAITAANVCIQAELNDNPTAKAITDALPIKAKAKRWGGEIYFTQTDRFFVSFQRRAYPER